MAATPSHRLRCAGNSSNGMATASVSSAEGANEANVPGTPAVPPVASCAPITCGLSAAPCTVAGTAAGSITSGGGAENHNHTITSAAIAATTRATTESQRLSGSSRIGPTRARHSETSRITGVPTASTRPICRARRLVRLPWTSNTGGDGTRASTALASGTASRTMTIQMAVPHATSTNGVASRTPSTAAITPTATNHRHEWSSVSPTAWNQCGHHAHPLAPGPAKYAATPGGRSSARISASAVCEPPAGSMENGATCTPAR